MPIGRTIFISLLLVFSLFFTGCNAEEKESIKTSKVLLKGTPNEDNYQLAQKYFAEGENEKALAAQLKQLEEDLKYYADDSLEIALTYNDIGLVYDELKEYEKAIEYYTKTIKIDEVRLGSNSTERSTTFFNIALSYDKLKEYDQAIEYYLKALKIDELLLGTNHEDVLAEYEGLAESYEHVSKVNLSLKYSKKALAFKEYNYGKEDLRTKEARAEVEAKEKKIK